MLLDEVAPGVWRAGSKYVNWYIVDGGTEGLTVVDAGFRGYVKKLDKTLARIGKSRADVKATVLTHGHVDHVGMASELAHSGATIFMHPADFEIAADPTSVKNEGRVGKYLLYPGISAFVLHSVAKGALLPTDFPPFEPIADGETMDVPGNPTVTHVPGHTDGSCVLEFHEHGVALVGDLICTVSPVSGRRNGPQILTRVSNKNSAKALSSLDLVEGIKAKIILPGHGDPYLDGIESAIASAKAVGCR